MLILIVAYHTSCSRARKEPSVTRNVVFVWAIRHPGMCPFCVCSFTVSNRAYPDHINLIYGDLLEALSNLPANLNVDVRIHITGSEDSALLSSESSSITTDTEEDEKAMSKMLRLPKTQVSQGRPDVEDILKDACSLAQGEVSVNGEHASSRRLVTVLMPRDLSMRSRRFDGSCARRSAFWSRKPIDHSQRWSKH